MADAVTLNRVRSSEERGKGVIVSDLDDLEEEIDYIQAMFVQTADGATFSGNEVALENFSASTVYFADRPQRFVGHIHTGDFVNLWADGENSFADDPPNAVLAFVSDAAAKDLVLVLDEPRITGQTLRYSIQLLEGSVPSTAGPCTLFIDPFGRPLSPVSVAGMHRRDRRRVRRR